MSEHSPAFENRLMDFLQDQPQTAADLSERLDYHVGTIQSCLKKLGTRGLVECVGKYRRNIVWRMARTKRG